MLTCCLRPRRVGNRRGIALPLAVLVLTIVGAMVAVAFTVAWHEQVTGRNAVAAQHALAAAEEGADRVLARWSRATYNVLAVGDSVPIDGQAAIGGGWYRGVVLRLGARLFLVRSEGFSRDSATRRQVGRVVALRPLPISPEAALTALGTVEVYGGPAIDGRDAAPEFPGGCLAGPARPGLGVRSAAQVTTDGCGADGCLRGDPPLLSGHAVGDGALALLSDSAFASLSHLATVRIPGGTVGVRPATAGGSCALSDPFNWGAPRAGGPCAAHFPVVHVPGDLELAFGEGQGVLLIDGDLTLRSGAAFFGAILVRGTFRVAGAAGFVRGAVVAGSAVLEVPAGPDRPIVQFSSCGLGQALSGSARGYPLPERSWLDLP